jgi:hypothetical protein
MHECMKKESVKSFFEKSRESASAGGSSGSSKIVYDELG